MPPPRGWNSYDSSPPWSESMQASTEKDTLEDAEILASKLLPHGYDTLTLDSGWFGEDNFAAGGMGFKPVADKVHAHGLKFGLWIMGGVPRMAVEARTRVKGTQWTAADIAIVDGLIVGDCAALSGPGDSCTPAMRLWSADTIAREGASGCWRRSPPNAAAIVA
eukprot:gene4474-789_t